MEADNYDRLISKRDSLLKKSLNREMKLARINMKKEAEEEKKQNKNSEIVNMPKELHEPESRISVSPDIVSKEKEIAEQVLKNEITLSENNTGNKKGLFKSFWNKNKEETKESIETPEESPENSVEENPDEAEVKKVNQPEDKFMPAPKKEILEKEMEIDLKISRDTDLKLKKESPHIHKHGKIFKKNKNSEEEVRKEIVKNSAMHVSHLAEEVRGISESISKLKDEVGKAVVGQDEVINAFVCAILCDGHVLLEGVPGVAKTLIVKTLAEASGCSSNRIQFTVDLLPSDILGMTTYTPQKGFETIKGPIFANFIVADEINRSPPKTQSAMIESMQEKQVTIGKQTFKLPLPFFVMANNNPLEQSGVYDLPEAQVDRFLFKLLIDYPKSEEELKIMEDNMTIRKFESFGVKPVLSSEKIIHMQKITKEVYVDERVKEYIVRIIEKTRKKDFDNGQYIEWGGSPRASIGLFIASKAWALMHGRAYVIPKDVKDVAHYVLRHRIILNYRARAEKITSDTIIDEILDTIEI